MAFFRDTVSNQRPIPPAVPPSSQTDQEALRSQRAGFLQHLHAAGAVHERKGFNAVLGGRERSDASHLDEASQGDAVEHEHRCIK
jgi:hypothetical protein